MSWSVAAVVRVLALVLLATACESSPSDQAASDSETFQSDLTIDVSATQGADGKPDPGQSPPPPTDESAQLDAEDLPAAAMPSLLGAPVDLSFSGDAEMCAAINEDGHAAVTTPSIAGIQDAAEYLRVRLNRAWIDSRIEWSSTIVSVYASDVAGYLRELHDLYATQLPNIYVIEAAMADGIAACGEAGFVWSGEWPTP